MVVGNLKIAENSFTLMKRKVIQIANSTQLISLPRKWCIEHGIKKGDELEVEEQGNKIRVSTSKEEALETAKIHFSGVDSFLRRPFITFYKLGYDELEISFDDPKIIPKIQEEIGELMGFEIVNQTERTCTVRNVASAMDTEFDSILRRIMLMLIEMARDTSEALSKRKFSALEEIAKRERLNNKLTIFCERILNKKGYKDHRRLSFIYYIVCNLEHLADDVADIGIYCHRHEPKLNPTTLKLVKELSTLIEQVYDLFYKSSIEGIYAFKKRHSQLERQGTELLRSVPKESIPVMHSLLMAAEKLRHMSAYCINKSTTA